MIHLEITVADTAELLATAAYGAGAKLRWEWCATETGAYAEGGTVALVSGTSLYDVWDAAGVVGTWYKTRVSNAGGTSFSAYSAAFQGGGELLASIVDIKRRLGITDTTDDGWLQAQAVGITDEIESFTGRRFRPDPITGTKTVYLDYSGDGRTLWLPKGIRSVAYLGVAYSDQPDGGTGTYTEITSGVYIDPPEHERDPGWPGTSVSLGSTATTFFCRGRRTVKLTGAHGWAAVPATVRAIAEMCVVSAYRGRSSGGASSYTIGTEGERTYQRLLSAGDMKTLGWYRAMWVG